MPATKEGVVQYYRQSKILDCRLCVRISEDHHNTSPNSIHFTIALVDKTGNNIPTFPQDFNDMGWPEIHHVEKALREKLGGSLTESVIEPHGVLDLDAEPKPINLLPFKIKGQTREEILSKLEGALAELNFSTGKEPHFFTARLGKNSRLDPLALAELKALLQPHVDAANLQAVAEQAYETVAKSLKFEHGRQ